jgi:hypothetical protein
MATRFPLMKRILLVLYTEETMFGSPLIGFSYTYRNCWLQLLIPIGDGTILPLKCIKGFYENNAITKFSLSPNHYYICTQAPGSKQDIASVNLVPRSIETPFFSDYHKNYVLLLFFLKLVEDVSQ